MAPRRGGHESYSRVASNDAIVSRLAQQDRVPWYRKPNLRLLYFIMVPACLGVEVTSGQVFDGTMLNGLQAVPSWLEYFHHPGPALLGLMSSMYSLGCIAAVPFAPSIVDDFGRRHSIFIGSVLMMTGAVLQGAALNAAMFSIARFILGTGIVFSIVAASSLIGELSHPKERAVMTSLFNASYMIGSVSAAGLTFGTFSMMNNWGWRIPSFFQTVPSLLQFIFVWSIPESPRWLISKGRGEEAYAILVKYHAEGDEDSEFVKAEYTQIAQTLAEEMENAQMNWMEMFSTRGVRKRVIIASFLAVFTNWSGYGPITYFLSPVLDNVGFHDNRLKNVINFVNAGWNLVNATFLALLAPRYPRRKMFLASSISLLVILVAWTAASADYASTHNLGSAQIVLVLIFLYSPAYNLAFTSLTYTFLVELFPFHIRVRGITVAQWWNRSTGFVGQLVDPIGIHAAGWKYYLLYCVWMVFEVAFIYVMFPETSGRTLEELTFLFEDDHEGHVPRNIEAEALLRDHWLEAEAYNATDDHWEEASRGIWHRR